MKRLTSGIPGTGGVIRSSPEDFRVDELPLYPATGSGEHVFVEFEKTGITTRSAVDRIAKALGVNPANTGVAGLKDSRAVTRQRISLQGVDPARAVKLELERIRILSAISHGAKLRTGHLAGNRFRLRIRGVASGAHENAVASMAMLTERGVPNRFGTQRFGDRQDGHLLGEALVKSDWSEYLSLLLGRPRGTDTPALHRARVAFEDGDLRLARRELPPRRTDERKALEALHRKADPERAVRAVSKRTRMFQISAFQSSMFNSVLDQRLDALDKVEAGDYAFKHDSGAVFLVDDADLEQPRAERFEISPSGPMFGYKMVMPTGRVGEIEGAVLAAHDLTLESFRKPSGMKSKGERRPLRVPVAEPVVTPDGDDLLLEFALPPGSYATTVLDEVMKLDADG